MQNFLKDIASPMSRKRLYAAYSFVGLAIGCVQAGFGAVNAGSPDWLKICLAVYAFLGTGIGATAASNVTTAPPAPPTS